MLEIILLYSMVVIKTIQNLYFKCTLTFLCFGTSLAVFINRGLHGEYRLGIHGVNVSFLLLFPIFIVVILHVRQGTFFFVRSSFSFYRACLVTLVLSVYLVACYLSHNGLWCAQHPNIINAMCDKVIQFAEFAKSYNITLWWLTMGDLLAIHRGHDMPMFWEHDIDVCITPEQYPIFLKALKSNPGIFQAEPEFQKEGHWYLPIDMTKLGLLSTTKRTAEGVNIDIWTCPRLHGNISEVQYCKSIMNVPGSKAERHSQLKEFYGDYSVVRYAHHSWMCSIWTG